MALATWRSLVRSTAQVLETPECFAHFMGKDSAKYSATGGWGFGHLNATEGKSGDEAFMKTCFPCHAKAEKSDFVFTRYAP